MLKVEHLEAWGFKHALRGMRNPHNSWNKSDSWVDRSTGKEIYIVGDNDLTLMCKLYKAGTEHRKYLRQIFVSMDITAPLYWWKQFDTYKINVTSDSCSTMHTITSKKLTINDFSLEHLTKTVSPDFIEELIDSLNGLVDGYRNYDKYVHKGIMRSDITKKDIWYSIIQMLPSSYNQKRTITMTYENVVNIINQRKTHKLDEWKTIVDELLELPYVKAIMKGE